MSYLCDLLVLVTLLLGVISNWKQKFKSASQQRRQWRDQNNNDPLMRRALLVSIQQWTPSCSYGEYFCITNSQLSGVQVNAHNSLHGRQLLFCSLAQHILQIERFLLGNNRACTCSIIAFSVLILKTCAKWVLGRDIGPHAGAQMRNAQSERRATRTIIFWPWVRSNVFFALLTFAKCI